LSILLPTAWGTFEPAVRFVYQIQPDIPPFLFSFVYYLVAASVLLFFASRPAGLDDDAKIRADSISLEESDGTLEKPATTDLLPIQGGLELGTYLFIGNGLQVVGLKTVSSDRAAFLLQLTTIFVPLVQAIFARNLLAVPTKTWIACLIALCGVGLMGLDGAGDGSLSSLSSVSLDSLEFSQGDIFIVLGALSYTFHCIRLEGYAKTTSAVKLAAAKASTETLWSALTVTTCVVAALASSMDGSVLDVARSSGESIISYWEHSQNELQDTSANVDQWLTLAAAVTWTGLVTVAYTIYAQSFGQSRVKPATANLIYTIQPLFTALFAWAILGETLGPAGYAGGALIGSSVLLVIQDDDGSSDDKAIAD
jgi:drug/metabolite transporter (DMT)-like permease